MAGTSRSDDFVETAPEAPAKATAPLAVVAEDRYPERPYEQAVTAEHAAAVKAADQRRAELQRLRRRGE